MPNKKLKVASLFCGCGGSDLGMIGGFQFLNNYYSELNFEIVYAVDFDKWAVCYHLYDRCAFPNLAVEHV